MPDKISRLKKVRKILSVILLCLLGLIILIGILVNIPVIQNYLVHEVTSRLSEQLKTRVEIKHVDIRLFNSLDLEGALIEDLNKDTLLYAGRLQLRITDWFFFADRPVIKFVGLDNAQVNLLRPRNDSVWNYEFISDAFSGPSTGTQQQSGGVAFDLKKVDLRNIRINQVDQWIGEDMRGYAKRIYLDAKNLDLQKHNIDIQEISLDEPSFIISSYSASPLRKRRPRVNTPVEYDSTQLRWNNDNWKLIVKELTIKKGLFGVDNPEDSTKIEDGYFAPHHIRFSNINLSLTNTSIYKDSIIGDLSLSTKERSGFEVKKMTSRFKMSPVEMEFSHLDLETNRSHIGDYYTMQYSDFDDMSDYIDLVYMRANFKNCKVSSDDIAYFAPPLSTWKKEITINGNARGPVSNLKASDIDLQAGNTTRLKGSLEMRGLPDINETYIDFHADNLMTTGADVMQIMPVVKDINSAVRIDRLTSINFKGSYTGFINDFVAYGQFQTNLGQVNSDLNFKTNRDVPVYSGSLNTTNFNLGSLLNIPDLNEVTLKATLNGAGFNFRTLKVSLDADVQSISLYGYNYQNIKTKGEMNRKFFNGALAVDDPNLDMDFAGTIDFNQALPVFQFNSEIRKSDLKALHFVNDSLTLQAKLDLNFAGSNIDNFEGSARMYDVSLFKDNSRLEFDSLALKAETQGDQKTLQINGSEVQGYVKGKYSFLELPDAFQQLLYRYYPSYFLEPSNNDIHEDFQFKFEFGNVAKLIKGFTNQVAGFDYSTVEGSLNTETGNLGLNIQVPEASILQYQLKDIQVKGDGNARKVNLSGTVGQVLNSGKEVLVNPLILANSSNDTSYIKVDLQAQDTTSLDGFYARVVTVQQGMKVNFLNSAFTVNERQWNVTPGNEIYWSKHFLTVKNLKITRNDQSVTVETNEFNPDESRFIITLKNLNLADVIPAQLVTTRIEGITDGTINISDPTNNLDINAALRTRELRIDNDSIGLVTVDGTYLQHTGQATFAVKSDNYGMNFNAQGRVGLSKSDNGLDAVINMDGSSISLLNKYLVGYVRDLTGTVAGNLTVGGTTAQPSIRGKLVLDTVGVTVDYLGTRYRIPKLNVNVDDNLIEFGSFTVIDKFNTKGTANGYISHDHFDKLNFDFDVTGRKFLFLNTSANDNDLFYGDVIADGKVYFSGPLNDLQMHVLARPVRGTHFYLPISDSKDIGKYEYIKFKTYGTEQTAKKKKDDTKLTIKLDIAANPDAQIDVILDATTGDIISANGTGNLQIIANTDGDFSMFGNYEISNGSYNFNFQRVTSWKFDIEKNSSISWNGDPSEAIMNITAKYSLPKVSLYNLVGQAATMATNDKLATRQERVDVLINLKGALMKPDITYSIELPEVGTLSYESGVAAKLKEINNDQNKALLQIYGLLIANQFLPDDAGGGANVGITGKNSVGQAISAQASAILNNITGALLKGSGIGINVNYRAYNVGGLPDNSSVDRNQVSAGVTSNLFNNRFRLYAGGDYDWGKTATSASSNRFAGDFRIEYLLTPDGRVRINAFSKSDYDVYNLNNRTKSGLGISYVREYDRFLELFNKNRRRVPVQQPPADSTRVADSTNTKK
ncbi:translocation/assembly module TamB domain-containing protein [Chitinophaga sp. sic0106]|uniref:translocation/assembly module TamB domain-containing protein n=1 Tax=Chitinophaga sp. sic0106 TaxID=2854785 RepID=UPI001C473472|nr:translocation/assembly module TamB domain-containing protein [Chitinophaga sp. sic0106]MBV7533217.1 translocation/assembly module TamB [Chitinophaga sp. sic0106]